MAFLYENPEEYSKTCKCDIETAKIRCEYFMRLYQKMEKVTCPGCKAEHHKLCFDDDGGDYPTETFVSCTECWDTYSTDDKRIYDWIQYQVQYDEVLAISLGDEDYGIENWKEFVQTSTSELEKQKVTN